MQKPRVFSGIQATGRQTIGNFATVRNWPLLAQTNDCIYCVVDLHAITVTRKPEDLRRESMEMFASLLACGIDPEENILFMQSHVAGHSQLAWLLGCHTMFGELSRMHQFKDKSARHATNINAGLFTYPVLMAADILLYDTKIVPVGHDQKQHVELARDVCQRFNTVYGPVFVEPEPQIAKVGARIMSLADPTKKMSKSDENVNATIFLSDSKDDIVRKCKKAVTDTEPCVRYDPDNKPGVANLMTLYSIATGKDFTEIEKIFEGQGYGVFKPAVAEAIDALIAPVRAKTQALIEDRAYLEAFMKSGAARAEAIAQKTLQRVHEVMGFYENR